MTRFIHFTDEELDVMESAFCNEGLTYLVYEIRKEREYREMQTKCYENLINKLTRKCEFTFKKEDVKNG